MQEATACCEELYPGLKIVGMREGVVTAVFGLTLFIALRLLWFRCTNDCFSEKEDFAVPLMTILFLLISFSCASDVVRPAYTCALAITQSDIIKPIGVSLVHNRALRFQSLAPASSTAVLIESHLVDDIKVASTACI